MKVADNQAIQFFGNDMGRNYCLWNPEKLVSLLVSIPEAYYIINYIYYFMMQEFNG